MQTREFREESLTVASFESDFTGRMALHGMFERFQDIAGLHATHLNLGFDTLRKAGVAWMLSRVKVNIEDLPKWGDTVTLRTWPKGVDRLFAMRDFRLSSESGRPLALATTCWLLVDLEKGKPRRIESLNVDLRYPGAEHAIKFVPDKITPAARTVQVYEKSILASELDVNEHVNNAQYVKWIVDCFDPAHLWSKSVKSIQVNYLDQARYGDKIGVFISPDIDPEGAQYVEGVNLQNGGKVFQALIEWR